MDPQLYKTLAQKYQHFAETRSDQEILLTTRLARALSQINIKRAMTTKSSTGPSTRKLKKQQFLYVYCYGTPPLETQMKFLNFPGQTISLKYKPLQKGLTEQQVTNSPYSFLEWAKILNQEINKASKTKPIVLAYHSFGTYIASTYLHLFPSDRVIGMLDIGGAPLRFFPELQQTLAGFDMFTLQNIGDVIGAMYSSYKAVMTKKLKVGDQSVNANIMQHKQQLLAVFKCLKGQYGIDQEFALHRKWPKILKCFIYGRNDFLFTQPLLSQKAIYYSYLNVFEQSYQKKLEEVYYRIKGEKVTNVQEKFIFNIKGGSHSLHIQNKNKEAFQNIIKEYLEFIQEVYQPTESKL